MPSEGIYGVELFTPYWVVGLYTQEMIVHILMVSPDTTQLTNLHYNLFLSNLAPDNRRFWTS